MSNTNTEIIALEWEMFDEVNKGVVRAECQDDFATFNAMRNAQISAWSAKTRQCYLNDLETAKQTGRNLIREKYIHMMKTTEPLRYKLLLETIHKPDEDVRALAQKICQELMSQTQELFKSYPYVTASGRPLYSTQDFAGITSIETYQLGELLTYSVQTLEALQEDIDALTLRGEKLAEVILSNTVRFYGYGSISAAETATVTRARAENIEMSIGCKAD